ncbi:MAG: hypothetical protein NT062_37595, partial [Proteobacteria bacterium]|nr:hypothetical protein [Pseudomonadota bacterium]
ALALFRDGNTDLNDGAYIIAAKKYREALTHWKHPAIHYNLALALLNLDQPLEVYENLQAAIRYGEAPLEKEKFDKANEYIKLIDTQTIATIEVTCNKPGAEVLVDGKPVFTAPGKYTAKVRAGKHVFSAEPGKLMQGYTTKVKAPFIDPGSKYRVELKLYTTDELTRYKRRWEKKWFPWAVVAGGAVVAGVGGLLALSAQGSYDDFDKKIAGCNMASGGVGCSVTDSGFGSLRDSGDSKMAASYVMYGVGGATVAIGLTLAYLNRKTAYQIRGEDFEEESRRTAPASWHSGTSRSRLSESLGDI